MLKYGVLFWYSSMMPAVLLGGCLNFIFFNINQLYKWSEVLQKKNQLDTHRPRRDFVLAHVIMKVKYAETDHWKASEQTSNGWCSPLQVQKRTSKQGEGHREVERVMVSQGLACRGHEPGARASQAGEKGRRLQGHAASVSSPGAPRGLNAACVHCEGRIFLTWS